ncbi:MAG: 30S ribosomal protein S6 [Candidatus Magnetomorum sp.]|nr:30S ribosomal protein S6 [Candidatus Magnetomorum sp.]
MKRRYETILLFEIEAGDEAREAFLNRSKALIEQYDGKLLEQDEWGVRKLAYEVRRKIRGYYVRLDYYSQKEMVEEFERIIRLEDCVMKYLTILLEDTFDQEQYERNQIQAVPSDEDAEMSEDQAEETEPTDEDMSEVVQKDFDDEVDNSEITADDSVDTEGKEKGE